jgi:epoxyqueuosine reductase
VKVFVDTAPLMEKPLAEAAGLGWQGKHTNLVAASWAAGSSSASMLHHRWSWRPTTPRPTIAAAAGLPRHLPDGCLSRALPARCAALHLLPDHRAQGPDGREFREPMGNRIYGCDDCLAVCPWNKFAQAAGARAFHPRPDLTGPKLADLAALDDAGFRAIFRGSPIKRIGRDRFVRNVLIALGNAGDAALADVTPLLDDKSALVRGAAVWALSRLDQARFRNERGRRVVREGDADVIAEWG